MVDTIQIISEELDIDPPQKHYTWSYYHGKTLFANSLTSYTTIISVRHSAKQFANVLKVQPKIIEVKL